MKNLLTHKDLNESASRGQVLLVRVDMPNGDKKFLYAFLVQSASKFKKDGGELTMMHMDRSWPCWRIVRNTDTGGLKCSKSMWPKMLDGRHLVLNGKTKTPLHYKSLNYSDPNKFVRDFESVLDKEVNIEYR